MSYPVMYANFWTAELTGSVRVYKQPGQKVMMSHYSVRSATWGLVGRVPESLVMSGNSGCLVCSGIYEPAVGDRVNGRLRATCTGTTENDPGSVNFTFQSMTGEVLADTGVQKVTRGSVFVQG